MDLSQFGETTFALVGPGGARFADMNAGITPVFFRREVQNFAKSEQEGRAIFEMHEFVRIMIAGDPHNMHVAPVDATVKARYAVEYARWQETEKHKQEVGGTPLRAWPLMTPEKIAEFEALHIFNVEGLAQLPDVHLSKAFDLREWRERAKAYLEAAKNSAVSAKFAAENERLRATVEELRGQLQQQVAQIAKLIAAHEAAQAQRTVQQEAAQAQPGAMQSG